jgi:hypothetical protein
MNLYLLLAAAILLAVWYYNTLEFFGSDWMASHYGPSLWNGWNYGTADPRRGPQPEPTGYTTYRIN